MAGRGSRFAAAGYKDPKPLIPVGGKPMIQWVIENVRPKREHRFIFICLAEHLSKYPDVSATLSKVCPGSTIVEVDSITEGAACTVLLARKHIDNQDPLMIVNADQFVEIDINAYLDEMDHQCADGLIMTFWSDNPKWSYCKIGVDQNVAEVVEKKVVSNQATVGIYNYRFGSDFVRAADLMIKNDLRVNNEFYVAPVYNQLIAEGRKVVTKATGREYDGMFGLGVPEDLCFFKTTNHYSLGWSGGEEEIAFGLNKTKILTELYIKFFNQKNIAAIEAILAPEMVLDDPTIGLVKGSKAVSDFIKKFHKEYPSLEFSALNVFASESHSAIEFQLKLSSGILNGVDLIEWTDGKIVSLRVYLKR
jgi:dTDP-glucose pyrophosphorylase/predicted SnoaL-like aldol condensation-catalyzing enzyme